MSRDIVQCAHGVRGGIAVIGISRAVERITVVEVVPSRSFFSLQLDQASVYSLAFVENPNSYRAFILVLRELQND